jgi:hypothetical protein
METRFARTIDAVPHDRDSLVSTLFSIAAEVERIRAEITVLSDDEQVYFSTALTAIEATNVRLLDSLRPPRSEH